MHELYRLPLIPNAYSQYIGTTIWLKYVKHKSVPVGYFVSFFFIILIIKKT